jgi:uncharacterized protein YjbI with pentapeptide repeats
VLDGVDLTGIDANGVNFAAARMKRTTLIDAKLDTARFQRTDMTGSNLVGARQGSADLRGATGRI